MSKLSEEEILEIIEKLQCEYKEQQNDKKYNDYTVFKAKEYSKGLQGLLDLYNKEKEKREIAEENHKVLSLDLGQALKELGLYEDTIIADELVLEIKKRYISKDKIKEIFNNYSKSSLMENNTFLEFKKDLLGEE